MMVDSIKMKKLPLGKGVIAATILLTFYFFVLTLVTTFTYAFIQFFTYWYLMIPLVVVFGLQVSLYAYLRSFPKINVSTTSVAASGSVSGLGMVACCLHLLAPLIPLIGFSGAMIFFSQYSVAFLVIGLFSGLFGTFFMLGIARKTGLHVHNNFLRKVSGPDVRLGKVCILFLAVIIIPLSFFLADAHGMGDDTQEIVSSGSVFAEQTRSMNGLTIAITPELLADGEMAFFMRFDTHTGDLGFKVEDVVLLVDDTGNEYLATLWSGSPPGGHHRSGTVFFPELSSDASFITLIIYDVFGVDEWVYTWPIP